MKRFCAALCVVVSLAAPAGAASVSKTYSYFTVGGITLDEIELELARRGPQVRSTGKRHPGATQMEFTTRLGYEETAKGCRIVKATVALKAKVILPRWRRTARAEPDVRLVWDTLESDIRRHEESHVVIAKNHARELEHALLKIGRQKTCRIAADKAEAVQHKILGKHDRAQEEFDRVEAINFEKRMTRLMRYRLERMRGTID
jgi:predicted secreted Zn-dependent protease